MDGTRIKAVNNKDRNFTRSSLTKFIRAADERLEEYFARLDEGDVAENGTRGPVTESPRRKTAKVVPLLSPNATPNHMQPRFHTVESGRIVGVML